MSDGTAAAIGLFIGLIALIAAGGALTMLWLAWAYQSFGILAPLGFFESTIGYALTALVFGTFSGVGSRS